MILHLIIWVTLVMFVTGLWALAAEFTGWRRGKAVDKKYRTASLEAVGPQTGVIVMATRTDTELIPVVRPASL